MLIKCSECGNSVSDKAIACPRCGNPILGVEQSSSVPNPDTTTVAQDKLEVPGKGEIISGLIASNGKKRKRRGLLRTPLSVLIPSIFMSLLALLPAMIGTYVCVADSRGSNDFEVVIFSWCLSLIFLGMSISLIRGNSWPRVWFTIGLVLWLFAMLPNPGAFVIGLLIVVAWCCALYSASARHWFVANKRLAAHNKRLAKCRKLKSAILCAGILGLCLWPVWYSCPQ